MSSVGRQTSADGQRLDLDQEFRPKEPRHLHQRAGGRVSRVEELIPDLAKDREVVEVGHERGELDEIAWAGASRTEGSDQIPKHLRGLGREVSGSDDRTLRIQATWPAITIKLPPVTTASWL